MVVVLVGSWLLVFRHRDADVELAILDDVDAHEVTNFQRWCLGEFRARRGVPKLTQANYVMVTREMYAIVREARRDIRGIDLNYQVSRLAVLAFVPSTFDVAYSRILIPDYSIVGWIDWLFGTGRHIVSERIHELRRPPN